MFPIDVFQLVKLLSIAADNFVIPILLVPQLKTLSIAVRGSTLLATNWDDWRGALHATTFSAAAGDRCIEATLAVRQPVCDRHHDMTIAADAVDVHAFLVSVPFNIGVVVIVASRITAVEMQRAYILKLLRDQGVLQIHLDTVFHALIICLRFDMLCVPGAAV